MLLYLSLSSPQDTHGQLVTACVVFVCVSGSMKGMGLGAGLVSPNRASVGVSLSPARVPDVDPIDAAAHLQLLGESLSLIGHRLQETEVHTHTNHLFLASFNLAVVSKRTLFTYNRNVSFSHSYE